MNSGKKFENAWKNSIPDYCLYYRLYDPPQSFNQTSSSLRFSWKNPCDCFIFDSRSSIFYTLELKTTKNNFMTFEDINIEEKQSSKMIHKHQILALLDYFKFDNVISGFIFNFRDEEKSIETTYFQSIDDFVSMVNSINKKSFNERDLLTHNSKKIKGVKKRVNYIWDLNSFLKANYVQ